MQISKLAVLLVTNAIFVMLWPGVVPAADYKTITLDPTYDHDRFKTKVTGLQDRTLGNHLRKFRAYITLFDGKDDDNRDGEPDFLGIPHFVAYEIKQIDRPLAKGPPRPSSWITDKELSRQGIAPSDATYRYSKAFLTANKNWYVRGHLAMKHHAWRLGRNADWNTHTMLNAVPQRQNFNAGIWLDLEKKTATWADKFGRVWIIAGPIFEPQKNTPTKWLGEKVKGEMLIAIPDRLFKIVVKESEDGSIDTLAFIFPQDAPRGAPYDHKPYMTSIDIIEKKTGLDFLTALPDATEKKIEKRKTEELWPDK